MLHLKRAQRKYYLSHKEKVRERSHNYYLLHKVEMNKRTAIAKKQDRANKRKIVNDFKEGKPCIDCKQIFPNCAMHFDHRDPTKKIKPINKMLAMTYSLKKILNEIKKCDLVCANCHAIRHMKDFAIRYMKE